MKQYDTSNLVIRPDGSGNPRTLVEVTPERAGWDTIAFRAYRLAAGDDITFSAEGCECVVVILGGQVHVDSNRGHWRELGTRANVFAGLPTALYLPRGTHFIVSAHSNTELAVAWAPAMRDFPARLISPGDIAVEIRGGDHATRQINSIIPPGFPCDRLVVVEVYTPGGNWSSYPPHKHDVHRTAPDGTLLEADLDEIYYYRIEPPEGFAIQRIYTGPESPLQRAGHPIEAAVVARDNDVVLVPEGYHPVSSPVGYTTYYLNILAGSARSLAASDDPAHAWVKGTYETLDPRLPVYDVPDKEK